MRYYVLAALLLMNVPCAHAIMFNNEGIDTGKDFLKWDHLISLPAKIDTLNSKVQTLQKLCIASSALAVGTFIYFKWFNQPKEQKSGNDDNDFALLQ